MPYSDKAQYEHHRIVPPEKFKKGTFRTVPLSHTRYAGEKFDVPGAKAITAKLKKNKKWAVQAILIPKGIFGFSSNAIR